MRGDTRNWAIGLNRKWILKVNAPKVYLDKVFETGKHIFPIPGDSRYKKMFFFRLTVLGM